MAGPIYKLWMCRPTQAGYRLSQSEQSALQAKIGDATQQAGGRWVIGCDAAWANEQWTNWGVDEYPDIEAHQKTVDALLELNLWRYLDAFSVLGTLWQGSEMQPPTAARSGRAIYHMYLARWTENWYQLSGDEQEKLRARVVEAAQQVGWKGLLTCNCAWGNEKWAGFGVEEYPNIEAVQRHSQLLQELNWYNYVDSMTLLGTQSQSV